MHIVLFFITIPTFAFASWKDSILDYRSGNDSEFIPERLAYQLSWNGALKSGYLNIEFGKVDKRYPDSFISHANCQSTGLAHFLFPYSITFSSFAHLKNHRPMVFISYEKDDKEVVETKNKFKYPGVHFTSSTTLNKTKKKLSRQHIFNVKAAHDPLTAMLAIRKQSLKKGSIFHLCCHPFASPYLVTITVLGREKHLNYSCIKLDIKIQKIDVKTGALLHYKKLKKATMWITDDSQRVPVELRSKVFIGDVRATLLKKSRL